MAGQIYLGSLDELKAAVLAAGLQGAWSEDEDSQTYAFTTAASILRWCEADHSLTFHSGQEASDDLEAKVVAVLERRDKEAAERFDAAPREEEYPPEELG